MSERIWVLGASDPEMEMIEKLLRAVGETVEYATVFRDGSRRRVFPSEAYASDVEIGDGLRGGLAAVYAVECRPGVCFGDSIDWAGLAWAVDHHIPGDPGYGKAPKDFFRTQDNDCTADPYFFVQELCRDYGYDLDYCRDVVWIDIDGVEADANEVEDLERRYEGGEGIDASWTRTGYVDRWQTVQAYLTREGAKAYIAANGHRHGPLRIYTESAHRNEEIKLLRRVILAARDAEQRGYERGLRERRQKEQDG